jgi:DNA-directed RNA polymerase subunit RPC12/RpoP
VRHQWRGKIRYAVHPADDERRAWFGKPWDAEKVARFVPPRSMSRQAIDLLTGALGSVIGGLLRRLPRLPILRRRVVDLTDLMQCPSCAHRPLEIGGGYARCPACGWQTVVIIPT